MPISLTVPLMRSSFFRFLIIGFCNTVLTYLVFLTLLLRFDPQSSYFLSWVLGLLIVSFLYPRWAFNVQSGANKASSFVAIAIYVSTYLLGLFVLRLSIGVGLPPYLSIVCVYPVVALANYGLMRSVFSSFSKPRRG